MRYGVPYKGSKNAIAEWIIKNLPKADCFVDLFCGGCAVTHVALLSGKWNRFIINDIDERIPKLFIDAAYGKYTVENHKEWVSREEFHAKKDSDAYIALVWSFGNNGKDYIYSADIEQFKHDYHKAVYEDDTSLLEPYGYKISSSHQKAVYNRYLEFNRQIKRQIPQTQLEVLTRQVEIERLQSLQSLQKDYQDVVIPDNAVVYCDPPYANTNCGKYDGFDSDRFHEWARGQHNIFISEYSMPDDFVRVASIEKQVLSSAKGNSNKAIEGLYTNRQTWESMTDIQRDYYRTQNFEQPTIFDFMQYSKGGD